MAKLLDLLFEFNPEWAEQELTPERVEEEIKTAVYEQTKDAITSSYNTQEKAETIAEYLGGNWQRYFSRDWGETIVRNVKGNGFPDWDEVMEGVAKEAGIPEENVRTYFSEQQLDSLWWEEVQQEVQDNIEWAREWGEDFVVVGRSGGYWGLVYDAGWLTIKEKEAYEFIDNAWDELENDESFLKSLEVDMKKDYSGFNIVANTIIDKVSYHDEELTAVTPDVVKTFEELDTRIDNQIKQMESSRTWIDAFLANEWYHTEE